MHRPASPVEWHNHISRNTLLRRSMGRPMIVVWSPSKVMGQPAAINRRGCNHPLCLSIRRSRCIRRFAGQSACPCGRGRLSTKTVRVCGVADSLSTQRRSTIATPVSTSCKRPACCVVDAPCGKSIRSANARRIAASAFGGGWCAQHFAIEDAGGVGTHDEMTAA